MLMKHPKQLMNKRIHLRLKTQLKEWKYPPCIVQFSIPGIALPLIQADIYTSVMPTWEYGLFSTNSIKICFRSNPTLATGNLLLAIRSSRRSRILTLKQLQSLQTLLNRKGWFGGNISQYNGVNNDLLGLQLLKPDRALNQCRRIRYESRQSQHTLSASSTLLRSETTTSRRIFSLFKISMPSKCLKDGLYRAFWWYQLDDLGCSINYHPSVHLFICSFIFLFIPYVSQQTTFLKILVTITRQYFRWLSPDEEPVPPSPTHALVVVSCLSSALQRWYAHSPPCGLGCTQLDRDIDHTQA